MNTWDLFSEGNEKPTPHEKFKRGIKSAGYDMDAGAKRLEDLLAKQKAEREEREKGEQKNVSEANDEVDYDDDYQDMVRRVGEKAKAADALKAQGKEPQTKFNPKTGRYYVDHGQDKPVKENAEELSIGDPVIITGNVEFEGKTGDIDSFGDMKRFVVVNLYNHGKHSFHSSDVSLNDYPDSDEEESRMQEAGYGRNRGYTPGIPSPHAPTLGGRGRREDDEGWDRETPVTVWYILADGKLIKDKMGVPYHYRDKEVARKAAMTMMSKSFNAGKKFVLTTKPEDNPPENEAVLHTNYKRNRFKAIDQRDRAQNKASNMAMNRVNDEVDEGMSGQVVFSGTGTNGVKYEIIQSGDGFMIHANGKHIDTYGSLQRAMSVLQNEVPGLTKGVAEGLAPNKEAAKTLQNLKNLALMKSALTSQQLRQAGRESMLTDAINACIQYEQSYLQNKQQGNAIFVRALRDEIDNFRKGYPINSSMPEDNAPELGDLLQGKLGKLNFQQGVAEERTETKNEKGEVTSWRDESDWRKVSKDKDGRGRVTNLSDKARRETEKLKKEKSVNESQLDEGVVSKIASMALGMALAIGAGSSSAEEMWVYQDANTQKLRIAMSLQKVPADALMSFKVDTDNKTVSMIKGNQETPVQVQPAVVKQAQQQAQSKAEPKAEPRAEPKAEPTQIAKTKNDNISSSSIDIKGLNWNMDGQQVTDRLIELGILNSMSTWGGYNKLPKDPNATLKLMAPNGKFTYGGVDFGQSGSISLANGKLAMIEGNFSSEQWNGIVKAYSSKFGDPTISNNQVQSKAGAKFDNAVAIWNLADTIITIRARGGMGQVDFGSVQIRSKAGASKFKSFDDWEAERGSKDFEESMDEGWKSALGGAALAGAMALGGGTAHAQPSGEDFLPDIVAHVTFKVNGNTVTKDINLGTAFKSPGDASAALEKFLKSKGIKYFDYSLERVKSKDDNYLEKTPAVDTGHSGSIDSGPYRATGGNNDYMAKESIEEAVDRAAKSMMEDGYEFTEAANPAQQAAIAISMKKAGKKPKTEEKVRLDPKCWTGKKIGNPKTKIKGGVRVNNCVPK